MAAACTAGSYVMSAAITATGNIGHPAKILLECRQVTAVPEVGGFQKELETATGTNST
jgi:hypothetical protein